MTFDISIMSDTPAPHVGGGGIGDITSNERGSGARFNSGKAPLDLVPLRLIAVAFGETMLHPNVINALDCVGRFQTTGDRLHLDRAMSALRNYWPQCARVFDYGRRKYAAWNWAKGMPWSAPVACIGRHALAILQGEARDVESGELHEAHILCNLVMLATYVDTFPEGNDLPPPELFAARAAA